jgi:cytochrome P450
MLLCIITIAMCHYVQGIFAASTDTSMTAIEWALAELLKHPKFMKKVQDELDDVIGKDRVIDESDIPQLKYFQAFVKETFRLHPPATLMIPHQNLEACKIGGYHILPNTQIFVNVWAIHRHSSAYENPLEFNPDRFLQTNVDLKGKHFELLPFGSGRRICPGILLGLLTVQMHLARLLHSFTWKLPKGENPQDMDMGERFGLTTRKSIPLQAIAIARLPQHLYLAPQFT